MEVPEDLKETWPALALALAGLVIAAAVALAMFGMGMTDAKDLVAVIGVFTGVTGTLVGTLLGIHAGSSGKADLRSQMDRLHTEKTALQHERDQMLVIKERAIASVTDQDRQQELRAM
jgi:hypothetical protein